MGLWLLQESLRTWALDGTPDELPAAPPTAARLDQAGAVESTALGSVRQEG